MVFAWCEQSYATDSLSLQQMPLFAVRNPTTFCKAKGGKKQTPAAARLSTLNNTSIIFFSSINSSSLPIFTAKSFPPVVIMLIFVQRQLLFRRSRRQFSFCQNQQAMGGPHLRPVRMDSHEGALCRHVRLPFQCQKRNQGLIFKWSKREKWQIAQGRQKKSWAL